MYLKHQLAAFMLIAFCANPAPAALAATADQLHEHPVWLRLGHYQRDRIGSGYTSQADDERFFFSPKGRHSPQKELAATLAAMGEPATAENHPGCRFPARYAWLSQQLNWDRPAPECPDYEAWLRELNTESVTLVFAASYLNSPSSMFGHTFLRLDPEEESRAGSLMLAKTISYAADASAGDNELVFAIKGLIGGYPGVTTIQPYYEKIRLYSALEHRDLWEYRLDLDRDEVDMLLAHAWELRDTTFDYFFLDENCAYRLLALIDVAKENSSLLSNVTTHAIPTDTVRWVTKSGLVADITYRPSAATRVEYQMSRLPDRLRSLSIRIASGEVDPANDPDYQSLTDEEKAQLLDATYEYLRYKSEADGLPAQFAAPLSHQLLLARSRLDNPPSETTPPMPDIRDDQGHETFRAGVSGGVMGDRDFIGFSAQPAYHTMTDPPGGYRPGAELEFLTAKARLYVDNHEWQAEQITLLGLRSLSPRTEFFSPLSWHMSLGGRRTETRDHRPFAGYAEGGAGGSWSVARNTQAFAIATADLEIDDDIRRGYDVAPGADLGLLLQSSHVSLLTGVKTKAWIISNQHRQDQIYGKAGLHIGREFSLYAQATREDHFDRYQTTWQIGLHAYF